jgi:simple sugar transport system permease protein
MEPAHDAEDRMSELTLVVVFLAQVVRIGVPYFFAAAGGVLSERVGVIALSLEGYMLTGAFCTALGAYYSGSPWVGMLCGLAGGALSALLLAIATVRFRADNVVAGIAINLLAIGATRFFLRLAFDSTSNSPRVPGFGGDAPGGGVLATLASPLVWLGIVALPILAWVLYRTPFGLRARAVGEHPQAAATLGVPVQRIRYLGADPAPGARARPVAVRRDDPLPADDRRPRRRRRPLGAAGVAREGGVTPDDPAGAPR